METKRELGIAEKLQRTIPERRCSAQNKESENGERRMKGVKPARSSSSPAAAVAASSTSTLRTAARTITSQDRGKPHRAAE